MDKKILKSLKCGFCQNIFFEPVSLPCGDTVCKAHIKQADKHIICPLCGSMYPKADSAELVINSVVNQLIQDHLSNLNFGLNYEKSVQSCETLLEEINKNESIIGMPNEIFEDIKTEIGLKNKKLKVEIDEFSQKVFDELAICEKKCTELSTLKGFLEQFRKKNESAKHNCMKWQQELSELKVDEERWRAIEQESAILRADLRRILGLLKDLLLMDKGFLVEAFMHLDIKVPVQPTCEVDMSESPLYNDEDYEFIRY